MRALFTAVLTLVLSTAALIGRAEEQNAPAAPEGPPEQHSTIRGTPPADLEGRWLTVGSAELPRQQGIATAAQLWEITREHDQLVLKVQLFGLPDGQTKALEEADKNKQAWRPSAEDIAKIAAAWGTQPDADLRLATIENEIIGRDGFDNELTKDTKTRDAVWVVRQRQHFRPSAAPTIRHIHVYSALKATDSGYTGNYSTAIIAAAPLPIPIAFDGTFQAYRLSRAPAPAPAPARAKGFLARLADLFAGCGRH